MCIQRACCAVNVHYVSASESIKSRSPSRQGWDEGWLRMASESSTWRWHQQPSALPLWRGSLLKFDLHISLCLCHTRVLPPTCAVVVYGLKHILSGLIPLTAGVLHLNSKLIFPWGWFVQHCDDGTFYTCVPMHIISPLVNGIAYRLIHYRNNW